MNEVAGKRVMVIGLGVTGRSLARFLAARGARLVLVDHRTDAAPEPIAGAELLLGPEDAGWLHGVELVVASPGVPRDSILLRAAVAARIRVISEVELASRFLNGPLVAITGTNGKSTVTVMLGEIFKAAGRNPFVGGNLGTPLIEAVGASHDLAVVEVSSFQLEWIERFRPAVAIHLNLTDDHFERYTGLEEYGRAKARLFENQEASDWAILNRNDPNVWKLRSAIRSRVLSFGLDVPGAPPAIWREGNKLVFDDGARRLRVGIAQLRLPGRHNVLNAMAAAAAALVSGVEPAAIEEVFARFTALPHRTELVREKDGVRYIDDSKGTNVGSVVQALAAVPGPVILIAGGTDKGGDYGPLRAPLREKARLVILIGAARERMREALAGCAPIEPLATLAEAVKRAAMLARPGDAVLLSPACSSFDQFKDYAERGRIFQELVRKL